MMRRSSGNNAAGKSRINAALSGSRNTTRLTLTPDLLLKNKSEPWLRSSLIVHSLRCGQPRGTEDQPVEHPRKAHINDEDHNHRQIERRRDLIADQQ